MVIHVKDAETDALVRELAETRGVGITAAIREAVAEALAAEKGRIDKRPIEQRLKPLLDRLDKLPRSPIVTDKQFFDRAWGEEND